MKVGDGYAPFRLKIMNCITKSSGKYVLYLAFIAILL
jgi:hypothetical protein